MVSHQLFDNFAKKRKHRNRSVVIQIRAITVFENENHPMAFQFTWENTNLKKKVNDNRKNAGNMLCNYIDIIGVIVIDASARQFRGFNYEQYFTR